MQQSPQRVRLKKQSRDSEKGKPKFEVARQEEAKNFRLTPMNKKQIEYLSYLEDQDVSIIIATGFAGTSKTYLPTAWACKQYLQNRLYKFVLSRPAISNSKSLGFFTGDHIEKMKIWLGPVLSVMKECLNSERTDLAIKRGDVEFIPLEVIKGTSLSSNDPNKPIVFLVDEAEDLNKEEVIKLVTRVGKNCKLVLAGDILQSELNEKSGLKWLIDFKYKHNLKEIHHVDFNDINDIVRSDTVKRFITCLQKDQKPEDKNKIPTFKSKNVTVV